MAAPRFSQIVKPFKATRASLGIVFLLVLLLCAVQWTRAGEAVEVQISQRLLFSLRGLLVKPSIDPRIKIFSYDDKTASGLNAMDISLASWAKIFAALDQRNPKGIFIDKLFDKPYSADEMRQFVDAVRSTKAPVYVDSFLSRDKIKFRSELSADRSYNRASWFGRDAVPADEWPRVVSEFQYGPSSGLAAAFTGFGHAVYDESGRIRPVVRLGDDTFVPHWALLAADSVRIQDSKLTVNGVPVGLERQGRTIVNVQPRQVYASSAYAMITLVQFADQGKPISVIHEGDYVVILPAMYTGNTDWRETPLGAMQGGYIMTALLDSVLRGNWLWPIEDRGLSIVVLSLAGAIAAATVPLVWTWIGIGGFVALLALLVPASFIYLNTLLPWVLPTIGMVLSALAVSAQRSVQSQMEKVRMDEELATAHIVQESFLPKVAATGSQFEVASFFQSATECGGDFWGHYVLAPGRELFIIGDATGHGVPAALVTAMSFATCVTVAGGGGGEAARGSPAEILKSLNHVLVATKTGQSTMTSFVAIWDKVSQTLTYSNCGQNFPYLISAPSPGHEGRLIIKPLMGATSSIMGMEETEIAFENATVQFHHGDVFFMYTDGLIENSSEKGEAFGKIRLLNLLRTKQNRPAELVDAIRGSATSHFGKQPLIDDFTVVAASLL